MLQPLASSMSVQCSLPVMRIPRSIMIKLRKRPVLSARLLLFLLPLARHCPGYCTQQELLRHPQRVTIAHLLRLDA